MTTDTLSTRPPTLNEIEKASEAASAFARALAHQNLPLRISENGAEVKIDLPPSLGHLLLDLLTHVANGEMVTFVPYGAELTTQQAADILNVSRPFLVKLLKSGDIGHHKVGSHRRISVSDLLEYKVRRDQNRSDGLTELQSLGQEYDAG